MRVLVTGGAGFIGGHLVDAFLARGDRVAVFDDLSTGSRDNLPDGVQLTVADVADAVAVQSLFAELRPELVLHLAAQADVRKSMDDPIHDGTVNLFGTINLLQAARRHGTERIVLASTGGAVYGEPKSLPVSEAHPTDPSCCYGASKRAAELYLGVFGQTWGVRTTALRFANVYGPRQDPKGEAGVVAIFSLAMLEGRPVTIFGDGSKTRDYVFVDDVVAAHLAVVEQEVDGAFNLGTGRPTSDQEVFDAIKRATGSDIEPIYGDRRTGEIEHIALDASRAAERFGWRPKVGFEEGIERSVAHYRQR